MVTARDGSGVGRAGTSVGVSMMNIWQVVVRVCDDMMPVHVAGDQLKLAGAMVLVSRIYGVRVLHGLMCMKMPMVR